MPIHARGVDKYVGIKCLAVSATAIGTENGHGLSIFEGRDACGERIARNPKKQTSHNCQDSRGYLLACHSANQPTDPCLETTHDPSLLLSYHLLRGCKTDLLDIECIIASDTPNPTQTTLAPFSARTYSPVQHLPTGSRKVGEEVITRLFLYDQHVLSQPQPLTRQISLHTRSSFLLQIMLVIHFFSIVHQLCARGILSAWNPREVLCGGWCSYGVRMTVEFPRRSMRLGQC